MREFSVKIYKFVHSRITICIKYSNKIQKRRIKRLFVHQYVDSSQIKLELDGFENAVTQLLRQNN